MTEWVRKGKERFVNLVINIKSGSNLEKAVKVQFQPDSLMSGCHTVSSLHTQENNKPVEFVKLCTMTAVGSKGQGEYHSLN